MTVSSLIIMSSPSTISKSSSSRINSLLSSSSYSTSPRFQLGFFLLLLFVSGSGSFSQLGFQVFYFAIRCGFRFISEEFVAKFIELSLISGSAPFISKVYSSNHHLNLPEIVLSSSIRIIN